MPDVLLAACTIAVVAAFSVGVAVAVVNVDFFAHVFVYFLFFFLRFIFFFSLLSAFLQQINEKPQVVGEYESGKAIPNPQLIAKLERALGARLPRPGKKAKK